MTSLPVDGRLSWRMPTMLCRKIIPLVLLESAESLLRHTYGQGTISGTATHNKTH